MSRKRSKDSQLRLALADVLPSAALRRRRNLILPRYLQEESCKPYLQDSGFDRAYKILIHWAELESAGDLDRKETALDADFLLEVFGKALGYRTGTEHPQDYELERNFTVPGTGTADGALGHFGTNREPAPTVVIELKGASTDLDVDKFDGRTPVQQCWDYLVALPKCPWGIVSNFVTFRLYHRDHTPLEFEHFKLQQLKDRRAFARFYCLFRRDGLLSTRVQPLPRALRLLRETMDRQREVSDELYNSCRSNRQALVHHLHTKHGRSVDEAIHIAQKILDRIIFVAFCEDRDLLPPKVIERTYKELPPYAKVTNPRWRNFLDLFEAIDRGHKSLGPKLEEGYNGGLFRKDPLVDDLQLDDEWTDFFQEVASYDFRDEINVDVLGHLFEKSITELERMRLGGLFDPGDKRDGAEPKMAKSAKRKQLGIYYTPPDFTRFLVDQTVNELIQDRLAAVSREHKVPPEGETGHLSPAKLTAYCNACIGALQNIMVCDPACGSGAFLIQAYEVFEEYYNTVLDLLNGHDSPRALELVQSVPDTILQHNLFGVDLSTEAVEITQLALWIRSARRGRTLADLSQNVVCGNSLVTDPAVDPHAIDWADTFPGAFRRPEAGFDCVIGNPPWERLKLQEREFFAYSAPEIAGAVSAAKRRSMIAALEKKNPELFASYRAAKDRADAVLTHVRTSGEFPLTARGDINSYALFAELARKIVAPHGHVGLLVPSGIASDMTTKEFFGALMHHNSLSHLYDFENREGLFPDVHRSFKFSTLVFGGSAAKNKEADFVFFAHNMRDLADPDRHVRLSVEDMQKVNPNTRTCPIFRSNRDAELTKGIYDRVPVLIDKRRRDGGNPWGIRFLRMFDQTNDAEHFRTAEELAKEGYKLRGNRWVKRKSTYLPLYEAKMVQAYDHRAASVVIEKDKWMRQGQTEPTSLVFHQDPEFVVQPRWWVAEKTVTDVLGGREPTGFVGFKDITSPTNERTMIASAIPWAAVTNHFPLVRAETPPAITLCLLANLNAFVLDYAARQKIGGITLNFFIVEQLPILAPNAYEHRCPWHRRQTLAKWISDRVLKLTCTADDMAPFAEACGFKKGTHKWHASERARLKAQLDAAFFRLYGVKREDVEYILSTFSGVRRKDEAETGGFRVAELILEYFDDFD